MIRRNEEVSEQVSPSLCKRERGASLVEYSILVALIAIVAIVAVREVGETTHNQFAGIVDHLGGEKITQYK